MNQAFDPSYYLEVALEAARRLRRQGLRISTHEVITVLELLDSYMAVRGSELTEDEALYIFSSVFAKTREQEELVAKVVSSILRGGDALKGLYEELVRIVEHDLRVLGLSYGQRVSGKLLRVCASSSEKCLRIFRLGVLGLLRRKGDKFYVVNKRNAEAALRRLSSLAANTLEAVSISAAKAPWWLLRLLAHLDPETLAGAIDLTRLSAKQLLKLYSSASNFKTKRYVARALYDKIVSGEHMSRAEDLYKVIESEGLLTREVAEHLIRLEPSVAGRIARDHGVEFAIEASFKAFKKGLIDSKQFERAIAGIGLPYKAAKSIRYLAVRDSGIDLLVQEIANLKRGDKIVKALSKLYEARRAIDRALSELDPGSIDLAYYELSALNEIIHSMREKEIGSLVLYERIRAEAARLRAALSAYGEREVASSFRASLKGVADPLRVEARLPVNSVLLRGSSLRRLLLMWSLGRRIGKSISSHTAGKRVGVQQGRPDLRRTIMKLLRFAENPVVRRKRVGPESIILVLDKSASMSKYSAMVLAIAAGFARFIRRLVIFDHEAYVYDVRGRLSSRDALNLLKQLYATPFTGWTDIVNAVNLATRGLSPRKVVIVSDLKQTVKAPIEVRDAICHLSSLGWRVHIMVPKREYSADVLKSLRICAKVHTVEGLRDIKRSLIKIIG